MKNVNIIGIRWKISFFRGGCMKKKQFWGVNHLKRVAWIVWKKKGWCFWGGLRPNAHYELEEPSYWHKYPKQTTLQHSNINNNINYNWHIVSTYLKKKLSEVPNPENSKSLKLWSEKAIQGYHYLWVIECDDNHIRRMTKFWNCGVQ